MIGLAFWVVYCVVGAFVLRATGWPVGFSERWAAAIVIVFTGIHLGGWVNELIRARFPKLDKWNCP